MDNKQSVCDHCEQAAPKLYRCTRCSAARYCGAACQRAAYPQHSAACRAAAAQKNEEQAQATRASLRYAAVAEALRVHGQCPCLRPYEREVVARCRAGQCCYMACSEQADLSLPAAASRARYAAKCQQQQQPEVMHMLPLIFCGPAHAYLCKDDAAAYNKREEPAEEAPCAPQQTRCAGCNRFHSAAHGKKKKRSTTTHSAVAARAAMRKRLAAREDDAEMPNLVDYRTAK